MSSGDFLGSLRVTKLEWVLVALLLSFLELGLRVARFRSIMASFGHLLTWRSVIVVQFVGIFAGTLSPMRVAEPFKAVLLRKDHGVPLARGVVAAILERLQDLVVLALLLLLALFVVAQDTLTVSPGLVIIAAILLGALYVIFVWSLVTNRLAHLIRWFARKGGWMERLASSLDGAEVRQGLSLRSNLSWAVASVVILLIDVNIANALLIGQGFFVNFPLVLAVVAASTLGGIVSQAPGGIAATEAALVFFLGQIGVPAAIGLNVAILSRLASFYLFTAIGWAFAARAGLRFGREQTTSNSGAPPGDGP